VYAFADGSAGAELLQTLIAEWSGLPVTDVRDTSYMHEHHAAARHAMRVTSGLDSMVLGEDQIQGQMKRALAMGRDVGALGPVLERLGSAALACGKRVRTFTDVGRHSVSLESLAVRAAAAHVGSLETRDVLVLGAGESASLIARQLKAARAARVTIVSRSTERALALARRVDAEARSFADLADVLSRVDVVFCSTSAPHPVLTRDFLVHRASHREDATLLCVDLGLPRDVDPAVAAIPGVSVVTLDELSTMAAAHREARRAAIPAAEAIVDTELGRFVTWLRARSVAADIAAVGALASEVVERELERALTRLPSLHPGEREIVAELARRIGRKLSHQPIHALKQPEPEKMRVV
jgi:glutamyl-tRNA reductase